MTSLCFVFEFDKEHSQLYRIFSQEKQQQYQLEISAVIINQAEWDALYGPFLKFMKNQKIYNEIIREVLDGQQGRAR